MNQAPIRAENRIGALVAHAPASVGSLLALLRAADDPALRRHAGQALVTGIAGAVVPTVLSLIPALSCAAMPFAEILVALPGLLRRAGLSGPRRRDSRRLPLCGVGRGRRLTGSTRAPAGASDAMDTFGRLALLTGMLAGFGTLLLALAGLELLGAAAERLWLRHSPAAARQARVRALLGAYRERYAAQAAGKPRRNQP